MSLPPPTHQPWTWAITGLGQRQTHELRAGRVRARAIAKSLPGSHLPSVADVFVPVVGAAAEVEAGAERAPGAAQDDHLDRLVAAGECDGRLDPSGIGGTIVFSLSGRFSVIVATGPSAS